MQNLGVAIMYIMLGSVLYRFADKLQLRTSETSLKIGKYLYYTGFIILFGSISTLFPSVPDITSTFVAGIAVSIMALLALKEVKKMMVEIDDNQKTLKEDKE